MKALVWSLQPSRSDEVAGQINLRSKVQMFQAGGATEDLSRGRDQEPIIGERVFELSLHAVMYFDSVSTG
jgi:hypothetical protein